LQSITCWAGQKAKSSAAYDLALNCFKAGIKLLPENAWESCYQLCYSLHVECAQCEYMLGNVNEAERAVQSDNQLDENGF
jgi:predicted ATPase